MKKIIALAMIVVMLFSVCVYSVCAANAYGDINSDGSINAGDIVRLAQHIARWNINLTNDELNAADVNLDGSINTKDAVLLAQYIAKWDVVLGDGSQPPSGGDVTPPSGEDDPLGGGSVGDNEVPSGDIFD